MPAVAVVKSGSPREAVRRAVELVGGLSFVRRGYRVLIKPNLCCPKPYTTGATVCPEVVIELAKMVREAGGKPIIGESPIVGYKLSEILYKTGLGDLARKEGIEVADFDSEEPQEVVVQNSLVLESFLTAPTVLECDHIVSVAVMKTHMEAGVTLSMKNMKGCLWRSEKYKPHRLGLHQGIVDLCSTIRPSLAIIDATVGMEGAGPTAGDPVELGAVVAGQDFLATDAVGCVVMGHNPLEIPHIKLAGERGLGELDLSKIEVVGTPLEEVAHPFRTASGWERIGARVSAGIDLIKSLLRRGK